MRAATSSCDAGISADPPKVIGFGLLLAFVLFLSKALTELLGAEGGLALAAIAGVADVDAITLSTVHLVESGGLAADLGWRLILTGIMSNLVFKAGIVAVIGRAKALRAVAPYFAVALLCGTLLMFLWR